MIRQRFRDFETDAGGSAGEHHGSSGVQGRRHRPAVLSQDVAQGGETDQAGDEKLGRLEVRVVPYLGVYFQRIKKKEANFQRFLQRLSLKAFGISGIKGKW